MSGVAVQGEDYTFGNTIGNAVVIPAGSASQEIPVTVLDDWPTEGTEDMRIRLDTEMGTSGTPVPYTIGAPDRAPVNIADNEDPLAPLRAIVTVAAVDAVATETAGGSDPAVFRITRSNNLIPALNIRFTLGGTAEAGADYPAPPATITIPAGVEFVDVPIVPIDDPLVEASELLTFTVLPTDIVTVPSPAEAYVLGATTMAAAAIASDDLPPAPVVAIASPGSSATAASGHPITVNFTASAVDGYITSYALLSGSTVVASGTTNLPASTPAVPP